MTDKELADVFEELNWLLEKMKKEYVVWHEDDEYVVMEDEGWKLICVINHFKGRFHYEKKLQIIIILII